MARAYLHRKEPYHDLLGVPIPEAIDRKPRWRHFISLATLPWLADHIIDRLIVFPDSGYLCMAIENIMQLARLKKPQHALKTLALRDISFRRALVVPTTHRVELQLSLRPQSGSESSFYFVFAAILDGGKWYKHADGIVEGLWAEDMDGPGGGLGTRPRTTALLDWGNWIQRIKRLSQGCVPSTTPVRPTEQYIRLLALGLLLPLQTRNCYTSMAIVSLYFFIHEYANTIIGG